MNALHFIMYRPTSTIHDLQYSFYCRLYVCPDKTGIAAAVVVVAPRKNKLAKYKQSTPYSPSESKALVTDDAISTCFLVPATKYLSCDLWSSILD